MPLLLSLWVKKIHSPGAAPAPVAEEAARRKGSAKKRKPDPLEYVRNPGDIEYEIRRQEEITRKKREEPRVLAKASQKVPPRVSTAPVTVARTAKLTSELNKVELERSAEAATKALAVKAAERRVEAERLEAAERDDENALIMIVLALE